MCFYLLLLRKYRILFPKTEQNHMRLSVAGVQSLWLNYSWSLSVAEVHQPSVAEAPNIFTEKSRISATLNDRDFFCAL